MKVKTQTPEYHAWKNAVHRCHNSKNKSYPDYGGRGIQVCDQWRNDYQQFYKDVGPKPSPELTLDRIDNNKGYEPGNVEWRSRKVQQNNRRPHTNMGQRGLVVTINGRSQTIRRWSQETGVNMATIRSRYYAGKTDLALIAPPL